MATQIEHSSGDVFQDLGFDAEEAALLNVKREFFDALSAYIASFPSQEEAAKGLNVAQPRISEIVNGRMSKFSLDLLIRYCQRAGIDVEVEARYHAPA